MSLLLLAPAFAATMSFDVDGVLVKGDTLSLAPYGGTPVTEIDAVGYAFGGILTVLIDNENFVSADGRDLGPMDINPIIGTRVAGSALKGDPVGFYSYAPKGAASARLVVDGTFVFGTTSYFSTRQGEFVFGTTSYFKEKPKPRPKTQFVNGQTVYFRTARGDVVQVVGDVGGDGGDRHVAAAFGTELCSAAVWDAAELAYAAVVPCDSSIAYASATGDEVAEVPVATTAHQAWSEIARGYVPAFTWGWTPDERADTDGWVK